MFLEISNNIIERMKYLELIDEQDRKDGTTRLERLRQIDPETGKFLSLIAANSPQGEFVEIGTSAGYSAMWISLVVMERNIKLKTFELLESKIKLAKETFQKAEIEHYIELIEGDALEHIKKLNNIAFCFLDCEKEMYEPCWDILSDKFVKGGFLVADNALNHYKTIKPMIDKTMNDNRFDSLVVPIGKGELICRKK